MLQKVKKVNDFDKFRRNVRILRVAKGVDATQVSKDLQLPPRRMTQLEGNKANVPSAIELLKIANYYDVTPGDLMNGDPVIKFS